MADRRLTEGLSWVRWCQWNGGRRSGYVVSEWITAPATEARTCTVEECEAPDDGHFHERFEWVVWNGIDSAAGLTDSQLEAMKAVSHFLGGDDSDGPDDP